jgi:hypothetical protein
VVFQRHGCPEDRHQSVPGELDHRPAVALHDRTRAIDQLRHDLAQPFAAHRRGEAHRAHHVGANNTVTCLYSADWAVCVSRVPHSPQNLAVGPDCAPQEPQNNPVAVSPPPPSRLGSTSVSFHCCSVMSVKIAVPSPTRSSETLGCRLIRDMVGWAVRQIE